LVDDFSEYTFEDLDYWDKPRSFFGLGAVQRMVVQLLGQFDGIELHWKRHVKR
jgi:hypothetical protein